MISGIMKNCKISGKGETSYFQQGEDSENIVKELVFEICLGGWGLGIDKRCKKGYSNN